jgi:hypothetical protein
MLSPQDGEPLGRALKLALVRLCGQSPSASSNRARRHREQLVVERDDLAPVGALGRLRVGMHGGDGGLELVRAGPIAPQARANQCQSEMQAASPRAFRGATRLVEPS